MSDFSQSTETLGEIFATEEARRIEETKRELEAEAAAWEALDPEERARRLAAAETRRIALYGNDDDLDEASDEEE